MATLSINCDCGESYGRLSVGQDELVLPFIHSANIACGLHGGDPSTIRRTARLAVQNGVACGVHPSLPDLMGFGRRVMAIDPGELTDLLIYQMGATKTLIEAEGAVCAHVKPHGVLYAMLNEERYAEAFAEAVEAVDPNLAWICEAGKPTAQVAQRRGRRTLYEVTADRSYDSAGNLVITRNPEPVDPAFAVDQVRQVIETGHLRTTSGTSRPVEASLVCIHSDTPNSADVARAIRDYLDTL